MEILSPSSLLSKKKSSRAGMWDCGHCWCVWRQMKAANSSEACPRRTGSSARNFSSLHSTPTPLWCLTKNVNSLNKIMRSWTSSCNCSYCTSPPRCNEARAAVQTHRRRRGTRRTSTERQTRQRLRRRSLRARCRTLRTAARCWRRIR